jgi:hypothetical protein
MKLLIIKAGFAIMLTLVSSGTTFPQTDAGKEYQVKAAFLFNFTRFVEWPADAFPAPDSPFIFGVAGSNPFGTHLEEIIKEERINGHPLVLHYFKTSADITACHILYIALENKEEMKMALAQAKALNALTVSDISNFTKQGGMIRFVTEDNKTRIRINLSASKAAGLTISSKLLKLAEIVESNSN